MGFFSKLFGSKKQQEAYLIINDDFLELLILSHQMGQVVVHCNERVDLDEGAIRRGEIYSQSSFQQALISLFAHCSKVDIDHLNINVPFSQVYSFLKKYSSHLDEDYMKFNLNESIGSEAPFEMGDLIINYQLKTIGLKNIYSAFAFPRQWRSNIIEATSEIGIKKVNFIAEPTLHSYLIDFNSETPFAFISYQNKKWFASFFYGGLLYDSFQFSSVDTDGSVGEKEVELILNEFKASCDSFATHFGEKIAEVYFLDCPLDLYNQMSVGFEAEVAKCHYLNKSDFLVDSISNSNNCSFALLACYHSFLKNETY